MRILFYLFFSLYTFVSSAQEIYEKPAKFITQFPFKQLSGGVILIQAKFNKIDQPLNFILDTGSGGISLDSSTTAEFNIPHVSSGRSVNGIAGIHEVDYAQHNSITLPGLTVDSLDFYINDYDILSSVYGEKIDGIIGYSFISRYIININYDSMWIQVYHPGKYLYPQGGTLLHPLFTALPIQALTIKDSRTFDANFYFDTGAGLCFLMSKQFNDDSSVLRKKRKPVPIQVQGLGGKKQMLITVIKEVQIGPYKFRKVPTNILDDEFNATSYPFLGGLIGNDILRRFNVTINYPRREIHLLPNSHYRDNFDYSYTGMNMYYINGRIITDDVIKGSPAYRGGLKKDDVIIGVNNNLSNDISAYKNLMQNVGERINVLVLRNNVPMLISFRVGKIF
ncbi:MAG: aspartyl protease family protein [Bacteroidota bacterium]|nr:aspartyl protease family protein [Bacteroidota bacterium]